MKNEELKKKNLHSEFIESSAEALGISAAELVADDSKPAHNHLSPQPPLPLRFERQKSFHQQFIADAERLAY
jgi:hypothetical protein